MPLYDDKELPPLPPDPRIEAQKKAEAEAAALRRAEAAAAEARRKADEEAAARRRADDEAARQRAEAEAAKHRAENAKLRAEAEAAKNRADAEAAARQRAEAEAARRTQQSNSAPSYSQPSYSTPSYSGNNDYADKRGKFLSVVFGLICGIGVASTIGWIFNLITGISPFPVLPYLAIMVFVLVTAFKAWRNRKNILFLILLGISIPGWLVVFGVIPERSVSAQREQAAVITATANRDVLNVREGPSTSHEILKSLKRGDVITVTGEASGSWTPMEHEGTNGWVWTEYINMNAVSPPAGNQSGTSSRQAAPAAQNPAAIRDGIYLIRPRVQVTQGGIGRNLYIDRVVVSGQNFSVFYTGTPEGRGGYGEFYNFWSVPSYQIILENLDNPGQTYNRVSQNEDVDTADPRHTGGFYNTFQRVSGTRFRLSSTATTPPFVFESFTLGDREQ